LTQHLAIATTADDGYCLPAAAMLRSVVRHLPTGSSADVYFIDGGLSPENRRNVEQCCDSRVTLHWVPAIEIPGGELPDWGRLNSLTYQRLLLPELTQGTVDRLLYLDADMVVNQDLSRLWAEEHHGKTLLAVQDLAVPYVSSPLALQRYRDLGIPAHRKYFNAGVLLVDLKAWTERDLTARTFSYLREYYEDVVFHDQDALNAVAGDDWRELDVRWNQIASIAGQRFFAAPHLDSSEYRRLAQDPWIIHFAGAFKPWGSGCAGRGTELFFDYLDETPFRGWRPAPGMSDRLLHFYERRLRPIGYPFETAYLEWKAGVSRIHPASAARRDAA